MAISVILATTGDGITRAVRETSGHWQVDSLLAGQRVITLASDTQGETVFAGTQGSGILRSDDRGLTWRPAGLEGMIVKSLAVSPVESGLIYAGTKPARIYVSRDGGTTWRENQAFRRIPSRRLWLTPSEPPFVKPYVQAIVLSPKDAGVIVAGIESGAVVRSADGGETWEDHRPGALRDCHSLTFHSSNPDWVYEGGGTGVGAAFSRDAGRTWQQPKEGLDRHYGWACAGDPLRPEVWYVSAAPSAFKAHGKGNAEAHIFRWSDGRWRKVGGGLPQPLEHMPYALLTDPAQSGHVYAALSNGEVWGSTDFGEVWEELPVNLLAIQRVAIALWE